MWSSLLSSPSLPSYITANQAALSSAYAFTTDWLRVHDLPYRPANAGHFILVDFRAHIGLLEGDTREEQVAREVQLLNEFVAEGVFIAPGAVCLRSSGAKPRSTLKSFPRPQASHTRSSRQAGSALRTRFGAISSRWRCSGSRRCWSAGAPNDCKASCTFILPVSLRFAERVTLPL